MGALPQGLVNNSQLETLLQSNSFKEIETYSDNFLQKMGPYLTKYSLQWVKDPLHTWSRLWEYPFVDSYIKEHFHNTTKNEYHILDAGSGLTFFPFYLVENFNNTSMVCVDINPKLLKMYKKANEVTSSNIQFFLTEMNKINYPKESFDVIYCISVLEHTKNWTDIMAEFYRLLKPNGVLILTFDISLDGRSDISIVQAKNFLQDLQQFFSPTDKCVEFFIKEDIDFSDLNLLRTTPLFGKKNSLLPWKFPQLSAFLSSLKKGKSPSLNILDLTIFCSTFKKRKFQ